MPVLRRVVAQNDQLRRLPGELMLVAGAVAVNLFVRWSTLDDMDTAVRNARDVVALQQRLGLDWERPVQDATLTVPWLSDACAWFYVWGYFPVVLGSLAWMYVRRPPSYPRLRNALLASGALGVAVYAWYPCAPPRLVELGYADTVAGARVLDAAARPLGVANEIAAMPSFHVGWVALVCVVMFGAIHSVVVRAWCVVHPLAMGYAVVATGNHWVLDIPAGLAVAGFGLLVATVGARRLRIADQRRGSTAERLATSASERAPEQSHG